MVALDVDFDVFKALTIRRQTEAMTYNHVLRELLELESPTDVQSEQPPGWTCKGVTLPDGTELKAELKGQAHVAKIENGKWVQGGENYSSPSAAAFAITEYGINGWVFWSVKRPSDPTWQSLSKLRVSYST